MKKLILIIGTLIICTNAHAFYTSKEQDMYKLMIGIKKKYPKATPIAVYAIMAKMEPMLMKQREKALKTVIRACESDVDVFCPKEEQISIDTVAKCISKNKSKVSFGCRRRIREKFEYSGGMPSAIK